MAKVIFQRLLETAGRNQEFVVDSAGLLEQEGTPATQSARFVIRERYGEDLLAEHRAKTINSAIVATAYKIVAMKADIQNAIIDKYSGARGKILALNIEDPIHQPLNVYRSCAMEIERTLQERFDEIIG
jgi:protein-tyrosine-phosphatase